MRRPYSYLLPHLYPSDPWQRRVQITTPSDLDHVKWDALSVHRRAPGNEIARKEQVQMHYARLPATPSEGCAAIGVALPGVGEVGAARAVGQGHAGGGAVGSGPAWREFDLLVEFARVLHACQT